MLKYVGSTSRYGNGRYLPTYLPTYVMYFSCDCDKFWCRYNSLSDPERENLEGVKLPSPSDLLKEALETALSVRYEELLGRYRYGTYLLITSIGINFSIYVLLLLKYFGRYRYRTVLGTGTYMTHIVGTLPNTVPIWYLPKYGTVGDLD